MGISKSSYDAVDGDLGPYEGRYANFCFGETASTPMCGMLSNSQVLVSFYWNGRWCHLEVGAFRRMRWVPTWAVHSGTWA